MKLSYPFHISSRLAPAVKIGDAVLSYDPTAKGNFVLESNDQTLAHVFQVNPPQCRITGATDESELQDAFTAALSFLSACAESRSYAERRGKDASEGENSGLFPESVGAWAQMHSDEIACLDMEITEADDLITE